MQNSPLVFPKSMKLYEELWIYSDRTGRADHGYMVHAAKCHWNFWAKFKFFKVLEFHISGHNVYFLAIGER